MHYIMFMQGGSHAVAMFYVSEQSHGYTFVWWPLPTMAYTAQCKYAHIMHFVHMATLVTYTLLCFLEFFCLVCGSLKKRKKHWWTPYKQMHTHCVYTCAWSMNHDRHQGYAVYDLPEEGCVCSLQPSLARPFSMFANNPETILRSLIIYRRTFKTNSWFQPRLAEHQIPWESLCLNLTSKVSEKFNPQMFSISLRLDPLQTGLSLLIY